MSSCSPTTPTPLPPGVAVPFDNSAIIRGDGRELQFSVDNTGDGTLVNANLTFQLRRQEASSDYRFNLDREHVGDFTVTTETDLLIAGTFILPPEATSTLPNRNLTLVYYFIVTPSGGNPFTFTGNFTVLPSAS